MLALRDATTRDFAQPVCLPTPCALHFVPRVWQVIVPLSSRASNGFVQARLARGVMEAFPAPKVRAARVSLRWAQERHVHLIRRAPQRPLITALSHHSCPLTAALARLHVHAACCKTRRVTGRAGRGPV